MIIIYIMHMGYGSNRICDITVTSYVFCLQIMLQAICTTTDGGKKM